MEERENIPNTKRHGQMDKSDRLGETKHRERRQREVDRLTETLRVKEREKQTGRHTDRKMDKLTERETETGTERCCLLVAKCPSNMRQRETNVKSQFSEKERSRKGEKNSF